MLVLDTNITITLEQYIYSLALANACSIKCIIMFKVFFKGTINLSLRVFIIIFKVC